MAAMTDDQQQQLQANQRLVARLYADTYDQKLDEQKNGAVSTLLELCAIDAARCTIRRRI